MSYIFEDNRPSRKPTKINYERLNHCFPTQRRQLDEAVQTNDPVTVANLVIEIVKVWDEIGAWPDDWAMLQRALDDVLPWRHQVNLEDVLSGQVVIKKTEK